MSDAQVHENGVHPSTLENKVEEAGHKVFAGNLAYSTTDEGLEAFFAPIVASEILSAHVIMRGSRSAGYGFVSLSTLEAAHKAVEALDKENLDGRAVIVEIAKPSEQKDRDRKERKAKRRPGRRGSKTVPGEVSEAEANGEVDKSAPDAAAGTSDVAKPKKKKKTNRKKKAAVEGEAPAADTTETEGADGAPKKAPRVRKPREPRPPRTPRAEGEDPVGEPSKTVVFVANLGFNVDDAALSALFTDAGINVVSARVARRRWGQPRKSKGFGFVDVGDEAEQNKAIATLEGKELDGRVIAVKVAVNAPRHEEDNEATAETPAPEAPVVAA